MAPLTLCGLAVLQHLLPGDKIEESLNLRESFSGKRNLLCEPTCQLEKKVPGVQVLLRRDQSP